MTSPAVLWPTILGLIFLAGGIYTYRRDLHAATLREALGLITLGPVFIAASLAAFAGEHFTAARSIAQLVPKWMPAHVPIAYFVGVAHLAAALSFFARRCVRWAAISLAIMFALFVLLMDLPATVKHPATRLFWILWVRQATFAMGALALFATDVRRGWPKWSNKVASIARVWAGFVLVFYGVEHLLHPEYSPGVPSTKVTAAWVPLPLVIAYVTGILLVAFGIAMFVRKYASPGGASAGLLMMLLTLALYVPEFFRALSPSQQVTALNFIFDTLLFAGTLLVITRAILDSESKPIAMSHPAI
jgi:uncharacterized membrane protein